VPGLRAGIAVNGFGYGDRKIVTAIKKQAETLMHTSNLFHTEPAMPSPSAWCARLPLEGVLHELGHRGLRGRDEVRAAHRQGAGRTEYVAFESSSTAARWARCR
jgi:acetylornithine/N-succinyldiaminopimelate aminotransferase